MIRASPGNAARSQLNQLSPHRDMLMDNRCYPSVRSSTSTAHYRSSGRADNADLGRPSFDAVDDGVGGGSAKRLQGDGTGDDQVVDSAFEVSGLKMCV